MRLSNRSSLSKVAVVVGDALRKQGIEAVLTGGACASIYTGGKYKSADLDFVLTVAVKQSHLDRAMESIGFLRRGDRYVHPDLAFFVEFPRGPLAIGEDIRILPVSRSSGRLVLGMLSATDACRDRLAAFYHWKDRQSLRVAVDIAVRHRVSLAFIRRWSATEGASDGFQEFRRELEGAREKRRRS